MGIMIMSVTLLRMRIYVRVPAGMRTSSRGICAFLVIMKGTKVQTFGARARAVAGACMVSCQ